MYDFSFFSLALLLGIGLAMDAFSISLANGLHEPDMKTGKVLGISGMFAFFQALMPLVGWVLVHTLARHFSIFERLVPWIALALLSYIGGKMLYEGIKNKEEESEARPLSLSLLIAQGIATSIDALSVGFTISEYTLMPALVTALIIALVTFVICLAGVKIGNKVGERLSGKASILGGAILIFIGLEIFITSFF